MAKNVRGNTLGNKRTDLTVLRGGLKNVSPALQSTLKNAVAKDVGNQSNLNEDNKFVNPHKLEKLSNVISNNITSVTDLRSITPYIDKAELIWQTILLNPNGKQDKPLSYYTQTSKFKNSVLHNELLSVWDEYFTNDYKIDRDLSKIVSDILWNTGSYTLFNLSRPGLDYLINGSEADSVSGNENLTNQLRASLDREFVNHNGKVLARNNGSFIRNPNSKVNKAKAPIVDGLESLLSGTPKQTNELEFNIFDDEMADVADITFTDNLSVLFIQKINERNRRRNVNDVIGLEDLGASISGVLHNKSAKPKGKGNKATKPNATTSNVTTEQMAKINDQLYPDRNVRNQSLQFVKSNDSLSTQPFGRGLTWHVPSEAVIPVHFNGSNDQHLDFIFLLDEEGNFLKNTSDADFYQSTKANKDSIKNKAKAGSANHMISSLKTIQEGKDCDFDMSEFIDLAKDSIIRRFTASIISGRGDGLSVTIDEATNKIFLARMFKKQGVRCLYVPGEAVTYLALKYNSMGMGQSLTQSAKSHIARLAAMDLADTLANLEGAQPHSQLVITPEEHDADPESTIAIARASYFQNNPRLHSLLSSAQLSIPQIVDALRESSLTVKVNPGDNKHVVAPDMSLERVDRESFKPVDMDSKQQVLNAVANYFNLPRSWIDVNEGENNFKIEAVTEFEMVNNQAALWQDALCEGLSDFQRKHARVNGQLLEDLINVINDNKKLWMPDSKVKIEGSDEEQIKVILSDFMANVYCELPTPVNVETTNKLEDSIATVEKLVQAWEEMSGSSIVMDDVIQLLGIDAERYSADDIKMSIKGLFLSEAFKRYNLPMPFDDIINDGKGGGIASLVANITAHNKNVGEFVSAYVMAKADSDKGILKSNKKKLLKKLADLDEAMEESEEEEQQQDDLDSPDQDVEDGGGDFDLDSEEPDDSGEPGEEVDDVDSEGGGEDSETGEDSTSVEGNDEEENPFG